MPTPTPAARRHALRLALLTAAALLLTLAPIRPAQAAPAPTGVLTETGQLLVAGSPVTGPYDLQFQLFNAATGGTQVGTTQSLPAVPVADGVFYAEINFGAVIGTPGLYLQTSYRKAGTTTYVIETPRKKLSEAGYADYATEAGYALTAGSAATAATSTVSNSTKALLTKSLAATVPTTGQVLTYNGTLWTPQTPVADAAYTAGGGLALAGGKFSIPSGGVTASMLSVPLALTGTSSSPLLLATNAGAGQGLYGTSAGSGVFGFNSVTGDSGLLGGAEPITGSQVPVGVFGNAVNSGSGYGVFGNSATSVGVVGNSNGNSAGVAGVSSSSGFDLAGGGIGVEGISGSGSGVSGGSNSGAAVFGNSNIGEGGHFITGDGLSGVYAESDGTDGNGVLGVANVGTDAFGVFGTSTSGYAGYFSGKVHVNGDLAISGAITAAVKNFKIDHPLDPEHKYLYHASVESDKMTNVYAGHAILNAGGAATVTLPDWFQALNGDFEYVLTCVGGFAPVYVSQEIAGNRFGIAGGRPGLKVSWQVTGVRHDAFALAHPLQVEEDKSDAEQGLYLHPDAFGQSEERGVDFALMQAHTAHGAVRAHGAAR